MKVRIVYAKDNNSLPANEFTKGVNKVIVFTGQSITHKGKFINLLPTSEYAQDYTATIKVEKVGEDTRTTVKNDVNLQSAKAKSQAIAFKFGKGKVVVTGEAAMLSAQLNREGKPLGMNYPGIDNIQFTLNILQWLGN